MRAWRYGDSNLWLQTTALTLRYSATTKEDILPSSSASFMLELWFGRCVAGLGERLINNPFRIDERTGTIYLTQSLSSDTWKEVSVFTLNVSATDDGRCCSNSK